MQTLLAFGDSLTWGADIENDRRHDFADRWPNVLQAGLGDGVEVVAEGLGGRTTAFDDHTGPTDRNGARILPTLLHSHYPLDLVILMLGTNDLKAHVCGSAVGAAAGMGRLAEIALRHPYGRNAPAPQVLIVSPPHFVARRGGGPPENGREIAESKRLAAAYLAAAEKFGSAFLDTATVAQSTDIDGVHLDAANSRAIGEALIPVVRGLLAD